ncbi:polysaccharide deacetylase family protein [Clostridium estertheticum]|uniref:polysaccharide deacetylase family protein n=1 Tax=Clostridium estertheticum TaxID=238834 RepID=UPI0013E90623|nr:polysaccharide deacetylase family protein [Clostridium estertheticum]MBZ9687626.1 polysaccharide deacetylase family protein [Clostridium estertheticum]
MKKILVVYENEKFKNQIEYAVQILFSNYCVDYSAIPYSKFDSDCKCDLIIYYGANIECDFANIIVMQGPLFGKNYLQKDSLLNNVEFYEGLPVFFSNKFCDFYFKDKEGKTIINIDIFQIIFYFLTCYEEFVFDEYDNKGRFNIANSILHKFNLLSRPVVNENICFFINVLKEKFNLSLQRKDLWEGREYAVMLSHDVDIITKHLSFKREIRLLLSMILIDKKPRQVFKRISDFINIKILKVQKDPLDTFDDILDLESEKNFKSSFYFMADEKTYDLKSNRVKEIFKNILDSGCEIGFHPGHNTSNDKRNFKNQLATLKGNIAETDVFGVRQHYLSFHGSKTWVIQDGSGLKYDSTVCFPELAGFKVGYCLPYKTYDLTQNSSLDLIEIPLILMDGSLFDYMNLNYEQSEEYIKKLILQVQKYSGVFVILWHNSAITKEYNQYSKQVFSWLYTFVEKQNCIVQSGINIYKMFLGQTYIK